MDLMNHCQQHGIRFFNLDGIDTCIKCVHEDKILFKQLSDDGLRLSSDRTDQLRDAIEAIRVIVARPEFTQLKNMINPADLKKVFAVLDLGNELFPDGDKTWVEG